MQAWLALVTRLPTQNATARMRLWRAQKALGCGVLRDGVYLLPVSEHASRALADLDRRVVEAGGTAWLLGVQGDGEAGDRALRGLFDRSADYARLIGEAAEGRSKLEAVDPVAAARIGRGLRRALDAVRAVDFFPGAGSERAEVAVREVEQAIRRRVSPDEPSPVDAAVARLDRAGYRGRVWATRRRLWVDRMASAWLIRRFVDPQARFLWLERPEDCPPRALGFDFDGATFTHVGKQVTFEVVAASFGLDADAGLSRIARAVRYLDVGGLPVPEAAGVAAVLRGARTRAPDDDALLDAASAVFDDLYAAYTQEQEQGEET